MMNSDPPQKWGKSTTEKCSRGWYFCSHADRTVFLHPKLVVVLVAVLHGCTIDLEVIVLLCKTSKQSRKL